MALSPQGIWFELFFSLEKLGQGNETKLQRDECLP